MPCGVCETRGLRKVKPFSFYYTGIESEEPTKIVVSGLFFGRGEWALTKLTWLQERHFHHTLKVFLPTPRFFFTSLVYKKFCETYFDFLV
jgi:hypothetical protein